MDQATRQLLQELLAHANDLATTLPREHIPRALWMKERIQAHLERGAPAPLWGTEHEALQRSQLLALEWADNGAAIWGLFEETTLQGMQIRRGPALYLKPFPGMEGAALERMGELADIAQIFKVVASKLRAAVPPIGEPANGVRALTTCQGCDESMLFDEAVWVADAKGEQQPYHAGCKPQETPTPKVPTRCNLNPCLCGSGCDLCRDCGARLGQHPPACDHDLKRRLGLRPKAGG